MGSFPGTLIFFGVYEFTKRKMLDAGINANVAYLSGGKEPSSVGLYSQDTHDVVMQVSLQIWRLRSFMFLRRLRRPVYSFRAAIITLISNPDTITALLQMLSAQSFVKKGFLRFSMATRLRFSAISHSLPCNSPSMSKNSG
jgi:hypothetical protein